MVPEEFVKAVESLYDWQHGGTSFYCDLFTLFQRADPSNKMKLSAAFPFHAQALEAWNNAGDMGNDLFRDYGLMK